MARNSFIFKSNSVGILVLLIFREEFLLISFVKETSIQRKSNIFKNMRKVMKSELEPCF